MAGKHTKPSNIKPAVNAHTPQSRFGSRSLRRKPSHDEKQPIPEATRTSVTPSTGQGWADTPGSVQL